MIRIRPAACAALLAVSCAAVAATPEDTIKYRQAVMMAMAGHVGAVSLIATGKAGRPENLVSHAEALAAISAEGGALFPAGSGIGRTDALPLIWEEPERFAKAAEDARLAAVALRDAARGGDRAQIGKTLKPVYDSCKGCHDRYRKEDSGG